MSDKIKSISHRSFDFCSAGNFIAATRQKPLQGRTPCRGYSGLPGGGPAGSMPHGLPRTRYYCCWWMPLCLSTKMAPLARFCCRLTCARSAAVSVPPLAARSARTS